MKRYLVLPLFAGLTAALLSTAAQAQPYCDALLDASALKKKYQRLAPIFSAQDTGWIFTSDQLDETFAMKSEAVDLFTKIVAQFEASGVPLAVMIAPPRPVIAGQGVVDATLGADGAYDVAKATASFNALIGQIQSTGAVAPNLLTIATATQDTRDSYFFKRDTHWTNTGAAISANALAEALGADGTAINLATLPVIETATERGSLSDIVEASCGMRDIGEPAPVYDYSSLRQGVDLLGDAPESALHVALLGTSFSDRYKRDQYQVADALVTAIGADVENFSTSGGGMIGPIEAYVLSGALAAKRHDMVIWEFPYTESLNSTSALRQLLGALRLSNQTGLAATQITLDAKARAEIDIAPNAQPDLIVIKDTPDGMRQVYVDVMLADGGKKTIKLRRKPSILATTDISQWVADLSGISRHQIASIRLRFDGSEAGKTVTLQYGA